VPLDGLPDWVPTAARTYMAHALDGRPLRTVAEDAGLSPSTVLRQVRRLEARRDDPLVDDALDWLEDAARDQRQIVQKDTDDMTAMPEKAALIDDATLEREARRVLRRLCEVDAILAVGKGMPQAVVLREGEGAPTRTATVPREVARAFVLKDWIACFRTGRVARYRITEAGRAALKRLLGSELRAKVEARGMAEAPSPFLTQHQIVGERVVTDERGQETLRVNLAESPLGVLARKRDKGGQPFLSMDLVVAGERLREDFERAQLGPRLGQDWDGFLTSGVKGGFRPGGGGGGSDAARARVSEALRALGPGLGDVVLRVCCFLEGLEAAEKRMGWSARSGKIVLRIALQRLKAHYEEGRA
jgi:DNA-binding MarR family transcriptional regulator